MPTHLVSVQFNSKNKKKKYKPKTFRSNFVKLERYIYYKKTSILVKIMSITEKIKYFKFSIRNNEPLSISVCVCLYKQRVM